MQWKLHLVQNIENAVDEKIKDTNRDEAIDNVLKVNEESILRKFQEAKERLDRMEMDESFWRKKWKNQWSRSIYLK